MNRSMLTLCTALVLCASACGGGGASTAPVTSTGGNNSGGNTGGQPVPDNTVIARAADAFDPSSLTVAVGTTVSFTFESTAHNVTFAAVNGRPADIAGLNANTTITRTFATAGTFPYQCTIHAGMSGTIIVQ